MISRRRPFPALVFLSHSSKDRPFATKLAAVLKRSRIPFWYSRTNLVGAQQWHQEIGKALARCDWFAVILSPDSVKSLWVERELTYVLNQKRYKGHIVPILYRRCNYKALSWTLEGFQMVRFTGSFEVGCKALLRVWGLDRALSRKRQEK